MSCIVLHIELADEIFLRSCEFLLMGVLRDTLFVLQKSENPQNKHSGIQESCTDLCGAVDVLITVSFQHCSHIVKGEYFARGLSTRFWATYWMKRWKTWMIMLVDDLVDTKADEDL